MLPILSVHFGLFESLPILAILHLTSNASRVFFNIRHIQWRWFLFFLLGSIPMLFVGYYFFLMVNSGFVITLAGVFLLVEVIFRRIYQSNRNLGNYGFFTGSLVSGFYGGIVGHGAPVSTAVMFALNLTPAAFIATDAMAGLVLTTILSFLFNMYFFITPEKLAWGVFLSIPVILGSWTGKYIFSRMSFRYYILAVEILFFVIGILMTITNFVGWYDNSIGLFYNLD